MRGVNVFILMVGCVLILSFVCQMEVGIDHKDLTADSRSIDEANPEINYATVELPHQIATDSGPFYIDGDEELVAMAILHDWDGDGTEEWPYIIAGYEIYVNDDADVSCIEIHNIEFTYFIIRDCTLQGAIAPNYDPDINPYGNLRAGIYLYNVYGCIITENTIIGNLEGIYLNQTTSCYVFDNECFGNIYDGICTVMYSTKNHIYDNYCHDNYWDGILIWGGSYENNITRNHCTNNHRAGITLVYTTLYGAAFQNNVSENTCVGNANWAIDIRGYCYENIIMNNYCEGSNIGLVISMAHDNTIFDNTVFDCNYGIHMWDTHQNTIRNNTCFDGGEFGFQVFYSTHNTFVLNNITNFETGIYLEESSDNLIYWNSILFNDIQVTVINSPSGNDWYHPEFLEGNIWSDYIGVDFDGDGIGDTDIPWPGEGYDLYPLVIDGDGDGISDYGELVIGTDPEDPDTDFDGFSDGDEWRLHFTDPLEPGPFYIDGDEELAEMAAYHEWEGSGEYEDPYIIEGYDIDVNDADVSCIEIRNIDSTYFIIRECTVTGASGPYANEYPNPPFIYARAGIYLYNVYYAEVTNNLVFGNCYGIRIDESYAVTISENMCHSNNWEGIAVILNSEQCIVRDNFCFANIDGIGYLGNGIGVGVGAYDNLIVQNLVFDNEGSGIMFFTAYDSIARENQCYGNLEWGIAVRGGSSGNQILENQCWNNYQGIYLDNSDSNTIADNECYSNSFEGIVVVYDSNWNLVTDNWCYDNLANGIGVGIGATSNTIEYNHVYNNGYAGIHFWNGDNNLVRWNDCIGNVEFGIALRGESSENQILENYCESNGVGIFLSESDSNIISKNTCLYSSSHGISIQLGSDSNWITENTCSYVTYNGVRVADSFYNVIENNLFVENGYGGVALIGSSYNTVENNQIFDCGLSAIFLLDSHANEISRNHCERNGWGIYLDNSDSNTITENQLIDNTEDGILLSEDCDWNTVVYNYCTGNYDGIRIGSDVGWNVIVNNLCYENTYYGIILEIGAMGCNVTRNLCVNNEWGILVNNNNSILFQNNCTGNYNGIEIHGFGNMVVSNFVKDNNVGVYLKGCSYNIIFYNFIIDNSIQALEVDSTDWNFWYDPYLLEGNVWSDYIGVDFDRDGIGDTDIAWPGPGFDLYPLVTGDFDNDGLSYYTELAIGTDPYNDDTDGDFFKDGDEWRFYFTDPLTFDTPQEVSEVIDSNLEELVDEGVLEQNDVTPLIRKLDAARDLMDRGKLFQATQKLRDFISQINAMINRGQLSEEEGYALIALAQALIDVIRSM